jgi:hypothetical protein
MVNPRKRFMIDGNEAFGLSGRHGFTEKPAIFARKNSVSSGLGRGLSAQYALDDSPAPRFQEGRV